MGIRNIITNTKRRLVRTTGACGVGLAAMLLALAGTTSCISDEGICIEDRPSFMEGNDVWMSFQVKNLKDSSRESSVPEKAPATSRANDEAGHPDEPGTADENAIAETAVDANSGMTLYLFDNQKRCLKMFDKADYQIKTSTSDGNTVSHLVVRVNKEYFSYAGNGDVDFYFMLIVNQNGIGQGGDNFPTDIWMKTPEQIAAAKTSFSFNGKDNGVAWKAGRNQANNATRYIPMSGIAKMKMTHDQLIAGELNGSPLSFDNAHNLGEITLQRNIAKIRILDAVAKQTDLSQPMQIEKVEVIGVNNKGTFIPYNDSELAWLEGTKDVEKPTVPAGTSFLSGDDNIVDMINAKAEHASTADPTQSYNEFYCYVPEIEGSDFQSIRLRFTIETKDKSTANFESIEKEISISDAKFQDQNRFDCIVRNHIYEYVVSYDEMGGVSLEVLVADWNDAGKFELEFDAPTYEMPKPWNTTATAPYAQPTVYYNADENSLNGTARFELKLTAPAGQTWQPTILDATADDYEVTVWVHDENGEHKEEAPHLASSQPREIRVRALKPENAGREFNLAISYTPSWSQGGSSLLKINNISVNSSTWTGSTQIDRITIKQIEQSAN